MASNAAVDDELDRTDHHYCLDNLCVHQKISDPYVRLPCPPENNLKPRLDWLNLPPCSVLCRVPNTNLSAVSVCSAWEAGCSAARSARPTTPPGPTPPLPPEVLAVVFGYLDAEDKGCAARVSRAWYEASMDPAAWKLHRVMLGAERLPSAALESMRRRRVRRIHVVGVETSRMLRSTVVGLPEMVDLSLRFCVVLTSWQLRRALRTPGPPPLSRLDLGYCVGLDDWGIESVARSVPTLRQLDLEHTGVGDEGLREIADHLPLLEHLNVAVCHRIGEPGAWHLARMPSLRRLSLRSCARFPDGGMLVMATVGTLRYTLRELDIGCCGELTGMGVRCCANFQRLIRLHVPRTRIDNTTVMMLCTYCPLIVDLKLANNPGLNDFVVAIVNQYLPRLRVLYLGRTAVTDYGVKALRLASLEVLSLADCEQLTDDSVAGLRERCPRLWLIDVYGCRSLTKRTLNELMRDPGFSPLGYNTLYSPRVHRVTC